MQKDFTILIGGEAGQGSRLAGNLIAKILSRLGYFIYVYEDYQSLIRGGHNFSQIRTSKNEIEARKEKVNFILALDKNTIELHKSKLEKNGLIIFNSDKIKESRGIGIPIESIVQREGGIPIMANTALVSGFFKILGVDFEILKEVFEKEIRKSVELNLKIAKRAFDEVKTLQKIKKLKRKLTAILTGNEAIGLGMIKAGLQFYFAYPMTPSTSIMNFLARKEEVKVIQPENEIAVINMALGTAYAGKRAAVGTSGGGFDLMVEALSLTGQSEVPILIIESQRGGPSTGLPTYNMQGDLNFVISAGHGEFPRFVIAPGDAEQCFYFAGLGLNLAWKYQVPVILLVDKDLSENTFSVKENIFDSFKTENPILWDGIGEYQRYKIEKDGISPLAFPGKENAIIKVNSYTHDEFGISNDREEIVKKIQQKRLRKYLKMKKDVEKLPAIKVYGNRKSKIVLISWGISKGAAREVAENLGVKMIQPIIIEPFPQKRIKKELEGVKKIFTVELNTLGQIAKILNQYGIKVDGNILKYDGRPFFVEEIERELRKLI